MWIPVEIFSEDFLYEYMAMHGLLAAGYRERLLEFGIPEEELEDINEIYFGCEKDWWPDKPWITEKIQELLTQDSENNV